jgi:oligoendopeptidase F
MWDLYAPVIGSVDYHVDYEKAQQIILEAVKPLGTDYVDNLRKGFGSRWVDVLENKGKRSGAYSGGAFGTAPYMLMNWKDKLEQMFTLAHEAGHSMHSFFSRRAQPFQYANYTIFVAEVASTCNEALLAHHLLEIESDSGHPGLPHRPPARCFPCHLLPADAVCRVRDDCPRAG